MNFRDNEISRYIETFLSKSYTNLPSTWSFSEFQAITCVPFQPSTMHLTYRVVFPIAPSASKYITFAASVSRQLHCTTYMEQSLGSDFCRHSQEAVQSCRSRGLFSALAESLSKENGTSTFEFWLTCHDDALGVKLSPLASESNICLEDCF